MKLLDLFRESEDEARVRALYVAAVEQARRPEFYLNLGVADTPDGRFDMVSLHVILLLRRLKRDHPGTADTAQALFDLMFADMDRNLREMGVGDVSVGKRVKGMAKGFYGRLAAYDAGLDVDDDSLAMALRRNLYRKTSPTDRQVETVAAYARAADTALRNTPLSTVLAGTVTFPPAPHAENLS